MTYFGARFPNRTAGTQPRHEHLTRPPVFATLVRKTRNFLRRPLSMQLSFVPVWCLLGIAKLLIFVLPFRRLAAGLGAFSGVAPWVPLIGQRQEMRARAIGRLLRWTARYAPWDANCFVQAIVARWLLGLFGIPHGLYLGLMRDNERGELQAHAWVAAGRVGVSGGSSFGRWSVVGCFVSPGAIGAGLP